MANLWATLPWGGGTGPEMVMLGHSPLEGGSALMTTAGASRVAGGARMTAGPLCGLPEVAQTMRDSMNANVIHFLDAMQ